MEGGELGSAEAKETQEAPETARPLRKTLHLPVRRPQGRQLAVTQGSQVQVHPHLGRHQASSLAFLASILSNLLYAHLDGKDSFMWIGPTPRVNITNHEQLKKIFSKKNDYPKPASNPLVKLLADGLTNDEGEKWARNRKIINPAFHMEKLKLMLPAFYSSCTEMVDRWEKMVSVERLCEVDAWVDLQNLTRDVISQTAFGSSFEEGKRIFELQEEQALLAIKARQSVYIPGWRFVPTNMSRRMKNIEKELQALLMDIVCRREKAMRAGEGAGDDLLGLLLQSNIKENVTMSLHDVIEECKTFYIAGQETTSVLLVWTIVLLSVHSGWQARAWEEVLQIFGTRKPGLDGLGHLKNVSLMLFSSC
ncbi:hypothetical protein NL676_023937 [Syzygium grande]|nr:hypothetical protein NL676_023937 [Syzygium grande]